MVVLETPLVTVVRKEEDLDLVKFCDIKRWYSLEEDIHVEFILEPKVKASTLDWIGLFREDWNTFESFVTFQRGLGKVVDPDNPRRRKVTFPFNKELINNVVLDFQYQFVYIDQYLDILGMSPLYKFILPLKTLSKESKSVPCVFKTMTLSEELLLSENPSGGKSNPTTCRLHKHPMYRNAVTTCTHCRPCGHDYYSVKEKAEMSYVECLRLSERLTNLECEVALHSLRLNENHYDRMTQNATNLNKINFPESKINSSESDKYISRPLSATSGLSNITHDLNCDANIIKKMIKMDEVLNRNSDDVSQDQNQDSSRKDVVLRVNMKEPRRSSSYPQGNETTKLNLYSDNYGARKCVSDGKLESVSTSEIDSPLILKAIIGHQEERIRRLTHILIQQGISEDTEEYDDYSETGGVDGEEEVVKLVKTEQRMLAQILRINSNCEEFSNEKELLEKKSCN